MTGGNITGGRVKDVQLAYSAQSINNLTVTSTSGDVWQCGDMRLETPYFFVLTIWHLGKIPHFSAL